MSWSVSFIGTPNKVADALDKHSETLAGQSLVEYDDAKPHLINLVKGNVSQFVSVTANGHSIFTSGVKTGGNLSVKIEPTYVNFVG